MHGTGFAGLKADQSASVVICAYSIERKSQLCAAIDSVLKQTRPSHEVIVVIDHNAAYQKDLEKQFPNVSVIANSATRGLSGARNSGVQHATGDIVGFIDDDAMADEHWLARLLEHYKNPSVAGVGGAVIPIWAKGKPRWFPEEFNWVVGCSYIGQPLVTMPVRNPIGCNMSFRRNVFAKIGGFFEGLGREGADASGCEETEFCIRAMQADPQCSILFDPQAIVRHQVPVERSQWSYFRKRCLAEGHSKTQMVETTGARHGLSSERRYVTRVLPLGIARGIAECITKGDFFGLARSCGILLGLGFTTYGYFGAGLRKNWGQGKPGTLFPIKILDLEILAPLPEISAEDKAANVTYAGIFCLMRQHGKPVGILEAAFAGQTLGSSQLKNLIHTQFGAPVPFAGRNTGAPSSTPFISVIIATRDRAASLSKCLESLLAQDYPAFEIVVVDNAPSSSQTADLVAQRFADTGRVHYICEPRPGLGRAHNSGVAKSTAEIIAFTDDDVMVDRNWLKAIVKGFESGENVGCVTGLILPAELDTRAQVWTEKHGGFGKGFERIVFEEKTASERGPLFPFTAGQFGSGANMAFRRSTLHTVGMFDAALGAGTKARGGDDLAAFHGVIRAGYQLVYEPEAIVWHHHRREEEGMRRQAFSYGMGLGAYLTKLVIDRPGDGMKLAGLFLKGVHHMMGPRSEKSRRLPADYPKSLVWRERMGIAFGPFAYLKSRFALKAKPRPGFAGGRYAADEK